MNTVNKTEIGENPNPATVLMAPNIKMSEMKLKIIMWPATMLAKRRMINAAGLITNTPNNSIGIKITFTKMGTPGGQKI